MVYKPENPVIVQSDRSILLETNSPDFESARDALASFAELIKSPEHYHTYRISPLSLWNAASAGLNADGIIQKLETYSKYDIPQNILQDVRDYVARYGRLKMIKEENGDLILVSDDEFLIMEITHNRMVKQLIEEQLDKRRVQVKHGMRGRLKNYFFNIRSI